MSKLLRSHDLPLGKGHPSWDGRPEKITVKEHALEVGGVQTETVYLHFDSGSVGYPYMMLEDAEALCYLLYDLTQPLRDAREKALKEQGGTDG